MNLEELIKVSGYSYVNFNYVAPFIEESTFFEADNMGLEYAKNNGIRNFDCAPFCLDKVKREDTRIIFNDNLKLFIDAMIGIAVLQSDKNGEKAENHEAAFTFIGRRDDEKNKIFITKAFWDEEGFGVDNRKKKNAAALIDDYSDLPMFSDPYQGNVTTVSDNYYHKQEKYCEKADNSGNFVIINGHTHPQLLRHGKVNNYPSREDVVLSITEAATHYGDYNGNCTYLNAVINADGDLNIFGFDMKKQKFVVFDKLVYKDSSTSINSLTEGNYPIQATKGDNQ